VLSIPLMMGNPLLVVIVFPRRLLRGDGHGHCGVGRPPRRWSMNSLVMPAYLGAAFKGLHTVLLNIKRVVIVGLVFLGYVFAVTIGSSTAWWTSASSPSRP